MPEGDDREQKKPSSARVKGKLPLERTLIFWLELGYLAALGTLAILYFTNVITPRRLLGPMPVAVPWFGALGGVVISLTGVFDHAYDWDPAQRLWHVSRPFLGATVGVVSVLLLQAGILAAGVNPNAAASGPPSPKIDNIFYYLVAFAVGYREQSFRVLMKRLLDVILAPGATTTASAPTIESLRPSQGSTAGGIPVTITGSGLGDIRSVRFGAEQAEFRVDSETQLTATSPPAEQAGSVVVTLTGPTGSTSGARFTYT